MRFCERFKRQMVPEWTEAYMDYNALKRILREILEQKESNQPSTPLRTLRRHFSFRRAFNALDPKFSSLPTSEGDIEDQVIGINVSQEEDDDGSRKLYKTQFLKLSEGGEIEARFFRKRDEELNKVNAFYKDKVEEMVEEASSLKKQLDALIALQG